MHTLSLLSKPRCLQVKVALDSVQHLVLQSLKGGDLLVVVEVVSPGSGNEKRDYRHKRSEYAARKIPEYSIVDPEAKRVTLLTLVEGLYEEAVFTGSDRLLSLTFPTLQISAEQVLSGKF